MEVEGIQKRGYECAEQKGLGTVFSRRRISDIFSEGVTTQTRQNCFSSWIRLILHFFLCSSLWLLYCVSQLISLRLSYHIQGIGSWAVEIYVHALRKVFTFPYSTHGSHWYGHCIISYYRLVYHIMLYHIISYYIT